VAEDNGTARKEQFERFGYEQSGSGPYPRDAADLLTEVARRGGSDLHVAVGRRPTMRFSGVLEQLDAPVLSPADTHALVRSIMTDEQHDTFEHDWECDFAYSVSGVARFRINAYWQRGTVGAACRYLPPTIGSFEELGLPPVLEDLALRPRGLVLVTGPTGAGKTTTLASVVDYINTNRCVHIITVEDPIEYVHQHKSSIVTQREVGSDTKAFSTALRYVLREDPDVVMIGEMRDLDTISAALTAAETGHLVFATLHTQDSAQTIDRVIDVFPSAQQQQVRIQLASTLMGIVSQQLVPTVDGCSRVLACEVLIPTPAVRNLIRESKTHQLGTILQTGRQYGMITMDESLADKYRAGLITYDMALAQALDPAFLRTMIQPPAEEPRAWGDDLGGPNPR
jgi:twitching motility protein PilT